MWQSTASPYFRRQPLSGTCGVAASRRRGCRTQRVSLRSPDGLSFKLLKPQNASTIYGEYRVVVSNGHDADERTFTLEAHVLFA